MLFFAFVRPIRLAGGLCFFNEKSESGGVIDGQFRKHLPVDFNSGFFQSINQPAVFETLGTAGGIDALRPDGAILPFFLFAPDIGMGHGAVNRNISLTDQFAAIGTKAASLFQDSFAAQT